MQAVKAKRNRARTKRRRMVLRGKGAPKRDLSKGIDIELSARATWFYTGLLLGKWFAELKEARRV